MQNLNASHSLKDASLFKEDRPINVNWRAAAKIYSDCSKPITEKALKSKAKKESEICAARRDLAFHLGTYLWQIDILESPSTESVAEIYKILKNEEENLKKIFRTDWSERQNHLKDFFMYSEGKSENEILCDFLSSIV